MARNKKALRIGARLAQWECDPRSVDSLIRALESLRLEALEPAERKVYAWIVDCNRAVLSQDVAAMFGIKLNHAGGILKALTSYGLLDRREEINDRGRQFIYTLHRSL